MDEFLKDYNIGEIKKTREITSGLVNRTHWVKTDQKEYILREYTESRGLESIQFDQEVMDYLVQSKFPAPKIIADKNNLFIKKNDNRYYSVYEYLPGHSLSGAEINSDHIQSVGEILGWFHELLKDYN